MPLNVKLRTLGTKRSLPRLVQPKDYKANQLGKEKISQSFLQLLAEKQHMRADHPTPHATTASALLVHVLSYFRQVVILQKPPLTPGTHRLLL